MNIIDINRTIEGGRSAEEESYNLHIKPEIIFIPLGDENSSQKKRIVLIPLKLHGKSSLQFLEKPNIRNLHELYYFLFLNDGKKYTAVGEQVTIDLFEQVLESLPYGQYFFPVKMIRGLSDEERLLRPAFVISVGLFSGLKKIKMRLIQENFKIETKKRQFLVYLEK